MIRKVWEGFWLVDREGNKQWRRKVMWRELELFGKAFFCDMKEEVMSHGG